MLSKCLKISGSPVSKNNYSQPSGCCGSFHFICSKERGILPNPQTYKSTLISFSSHFFIALDLHGFLTQRFSSSVGRQVPPPTFFFSFFFQEGILGHFRWKKLQFMLLCWLPGSVMGHSLEDTQKRKMLATVLDFWVAVFLFILAQILVNTLE